jgi:hypothetical protein
MHPNPPIVNSYTIDYQALLTRLSFRHLFRIAHYHNLRIPRAAPKSTVADLIASQLTRRFLDPGLNALPFTWTELQYLAQLSRLPAQDQPNST